MDLVVFFHSLLYYLGEYGPLLLILSTCILFYQKSTMLFYYIIGLFCNTLLNLLLKTAIQQPRPSFHSKNIELLRTHLSHFYYQRGIPFTIYGMPSTHAQTVWFTTVFLYLALRQTPRFYHQYQWMIPYYILFSIGICIHRVVFGYHTTLQVICGAVVGAAFAYIAYYFAKENVKGSLRLKPDDAAFVRPFLHSNVK